MNEKLILETVTNLIENHAKAMTVIAGLAAILDARLETLSPDERKMMRENSQNLLELAKRYEAPLERLRFALRNYL